MIEIIKAVLYGILEGITEWLPVSSTGHLILLEEILPLKLAPELGAEFAAEYFSMFEVVIQLGAIMAVVLLFWSEIWPFGLPKNNDGSIIKKDIFSLWFHILVSCVPAAVVGIFFDEQLEEWFYNYQTVAILLIIFGIAFIIVENKRNDRAATTNSLMEITYKTAFIIGMFQLIAAIFPGTSRSGATILGALLKGVSRTVAAEYTFFLAIPVMFGASLLKLIKFGLDFTGFELLILIVGMVVAFVVSILVIKLLLGYIKKHDFKVFGW